MKRNLRRGGYTLLEIILVLGIIAVLAAILFPIWEQRKDDEKRRSCQSNLKQLGLAFLMYQQDYADKLPPFAVHDVSSSVQPFVRPYGWADALYPYHKSLALLHCPSTQTVRGNDAVQSGFTDYWFNTNLSALSDQDIGNLAWVILLGEGNDGHDQTNARYHRSALPQSWLSDPQSPAFRHHGAGDYPGAGNYLFADSHVKPYRPQILETEDWFSLPRPSKP